MPRLQERKALSDVHRTHSTRRRGSWDRPQWSILPSHPLVLGNCFRVYRIVGYFENVEENWRLNQNWLSLASVHAKNNVLKTICFTLKSIAIHVRSLVDLKMARGSQYQVHLSISKLNIKDSEPNTTELAIQLICLSSARSKLYGLICLHAFLSAMSWGWLEGSQVPTRLEDYEEVPSFSPRPSDHRWM